ncbi:MAG: VWA domain-containing protein [Chloroflexi bacterium]|nr:VWA domain-containing protein [Chloroflexota bacterium]
MTIRRTIRIILLVATFVLLTAGIAQAQEPIMPEPPRWVPGVWTNPDWLTVDFHRVRAVINDQLATTSIDLQFTNTGEGLAEGTFVFPLPDNAAVDRLTMIIDGEAYEAKILSATEARQIYDEIVRQYRDPALLEYIGTQAIQANVFPIPPGETRRIQIDYSQLLPVDNGLIKYLYPLTTTRLVEQLSLSVEVTGQTPIGTVYSPSHQIAISRESDTSFRAGFEMTDAVADNDFTLYYGVDATEISVSLLTFKESAAADGFFLLLVQPPLRVDADAIQPKDIVLVIDQSGSMQGEKWTQAQAAARYVLENLNPEDRFNVVVFSTGVRTYASGLQSEDNASDAAAWIDSLYAEGGTDINAGLLTALDMVQERPATILFLTDGVPTEGITEVDSILANAADAAKPNARIFSFGVGDDVNTLLLDAIVRDFKGAGTYVRPSMRIDESMASLYNKISAPVLSDIAIDFGGVQTEVQYPAEVADLFAGEQIAIVGRYRNGQDNVTISLSGAVRGEPTTFVYDDLSFRENAGGDAFIARLWAQRRIADLLNTIRLNGESSELVDSVVSLSVRYGIITPYTSFLIEEDDILTQQGRRMAMEEAEMAMEDAFSDVTGAGAVNRAADLGAMSQAAAPAPMQTMTPAGTQMAPGEGQDADGSFGNEFRDTNALTTVGDKTFIQIDGVWTDTAFEPDTMTTEKVEFLSDAYFDLLDAMPELADYFALGEQVIVVLDGVAYEVTAE